MATSLTLARRWVVAAWPRVCTRYFSANAAGSIKSEPELLRDNSPEGVVTLTLNRPSKRNALSFSLLARLEAELLQLKDDGCVRHRAVVVRANGPVFCSGHDLKEMIELRDKSNNPEAKFLELFTLCSRVMQLIAEIPQPVVASVNGVATAAGCQLVAACDLAVAVSSARFATPGVDIGLFCSTPAVALSRCIGRKAAMHMLLTGRMVGAAEAKTLGLINDIVEDEAQLSQSIDTLASGLAARSGKALAIGKIAFARQTQESNLEKAYAAASSAMAEGLMTKDAVEGIDAFLQKRAPLWRHE